MESSCDRFLWSPSKVMLRKIFCCTSPSLSINDDITACPAAEPWARRGHSTLETASDRPPAPAPGIIDKFISIIICFLAPCLLTQSSHSSVLLSIICATIVTVYCVLNKFGSQLSKLIVDISTIIISSTLLSYADLAHNWVYSVLKCWRNVTNLVVHWVLLSIEI